MVKQLLFTHSIPGHHRPMGHPHLTWMDTMHDMGMGSLGHVLEIDLPRGLADLALYRDVWRGWSASAELLVEGVLVSGFRF